ncbi:MAG TPA: ATP-binding protein [Terriglobales bacterium]|nr:ATP-binding protein [Terriglobales bacterium]
MSGTQRTKSNKAQAKEKINQLQSRLKTAEDTLDAIRRGQVDAIVVDGPEGDRLFTLAGSDAAYRVFVESMSEGAVTIGPDGSVLYANSAFAAMIERPLDMVIGRYFRDFVTPSDTEKFEAIFRKPLFDRTRKGEVLLRTEAGRLVPAFISSSIFDKTSQTLCLVITDLSEQKRLEEIISAGRLAQTILQQAVEAIAVCDNSGRILLASHALHELCGINPLLEPFDRVLPLRLAPVERNSPERIFSINSVLSGESYRGTEVIFRRSPEKSVHLLLSATRLRTPAEPGTTACVVTLFDIEERRLAEEALRRSEKLAATGRLAATIAHEINNPLTSVTNLLYLLHTDPRLPKELAMFSEMAQGELSRVSHITKQTLAFHRESDAPVPVNLNEVIESVTYLLNSKIRNKQIKLIRETENTSDVMGFPNEIRQVVSNILENAVEASPEQGRITIRLYASEEWNNSHQPGVRLVVADDGAGIPAKNRQRIFEPFFTTKGEKGTGLGLWVTSGIVQKHGGYIRTRSRTEQERTGTVFSIFLPFNHAEGTVLKNSA